MRGSPIPKPESTTRARWASSTSGSGPTPTAWTTWSGCAGRRGSCARSAGTGSRTWSISFDRGAWTIILDAIDNAKPLVGVGFAWRESSAANADFQLRRLPQVALATVRTGLRRRARGCVMSRCARLPTRLADRGRGAGLLDFDDCVRGGVRALRGGHDRVRGGCFVEAVGSPALRNSQQTLVRVDLCDQLDVVAGQLELLGERRSITLAAGSFDPIRPSARRQGRCGARRRRRRSG
jgi:hypothetical protein